MTDAVGFLSEELPVEPTRVDLEEVFRTEGRYDVDFADVRGQEACKRALTIAAAGHHNILMLGPPGSGKTVYIRTNSGTTRLPGVSLDARLRRSRGTHHVRTRQTPNPGHPPPGSIRW